MNNKEFTPYQISQLEEARCAISALSVDRIISDAQYDEIMNVLIDAVKPGMSWGDFQGLLEETLDEDLFEEK